MKIAYFSTLILTLLLFQSCKTTKEFSELTSKDIKIKMTTGACFGSCPVFTLSVYDGGYAHFKGDRFTKMDGKWLKKMKKDDYTKLADIFAASSFDSFQDEYESELADLPMVRITYNSKTVAGKDGRPESLLTLQRMLEKIINNDGWTQLEASKLRSTNASPDRLESNKKPEYNYNQLIVEPNKGYALSKILAKYRTDYDLRLIKKIAPKGNLWLLTYNKSKVEPKVILSKLQSDKAIKNVEFNILITNR